jgi:hypothetical protein
LERKIGQRSTRSARLPDLVARLAASDAEVERDAALPSGAERLRGADGARWQMIALVMPSRRHQCVTRYPTLAAWKDRKRWADPALLNPCILRSGATVQEARGKMWSVGQQRLISRP